jgi:predicted transcriptional regulator
MADARLTLNTTVQTIIETDGGTVYQYINSNPGSNLAEIVAGVAISQIAVEKILTIMNAQGILRSVPNENGEIKYYSASGWENEMVTNIASARVWMNLNDNGLVSQLAIDLSVATEVALALGRMMEQEKRIVVTGIASE